LKYLFFDTETNGLPKNWKAPMSDLDNWPRVIQFASIVIDDEENVIHEFVALITPNGWTIPKEKFWIENNYYDEKSIEEGVTMLFALQEFVKNLEMCDMIVAHNFNFDYNVVGAEMLRLGITGKRLEKACTMQSSIELCRIPFPKGGRGYKFPKLEELHKYLFGNSFDGAHDALEDVRATARCFFEMKKLGIEFKH
jgi:DNA polymerase III subunit epsilon